MRQVKFEAKMMSLLFSNPVYNSDSKLALVASLAHSKVPPLMIPFRFAATVVQYFCEVGHKTYVCIPPPGSFAVKVRNTTLWRNDFMFRMSANCGRTCTIREIVITRWLVRVLLANSV